MLISRPVFKASTVSFSGGRVNNLRTCFSRMTEQNESIRSRRRGLDNMYYTGAERASSRLLGELNALALIYDLPSRVVPHN